MPSAPIMTIWTLNTPWFHLFSDKYGLFLNDTLSIGDLSITPGIRYDRMRPVGDFYQPEPGGCLEPDR